VAKAPRPKVNPELVAFLPRANDDLKAGLRAKLERDGVLEPILVFEDGDVADGHTRLELYQELGIEKFPVEIVFGPRTIEEKKAWMRDHQLHRRNLATNEWKYYWGMRFNEEKLPEGNPQFTQTEGVDKGLENKGETAERLAEASGKSRASVERAGAFAAALKLQPANMRPAILAGAVPASVVIAAQGKPLFCPGCIRKGFVRGCKDCKAIQAEVKKGGKPDRVKPSPLTKLRNDLLKLAREKLMATTIDQWWKGVVDTATRIAAEYGFRAKRPDGPAPE
jgi:ParB/Sulfiredoxin domain